MDFRDAVTEKLDKLISSGKVEALIEDKLLKLVDSLLEDSLRSYSDFGKALSKQLQESIKIDSVQGLPAYNNLVLKIIQKQVDGQIAEAMNTQIAEQVKELLRSPESEVKLSELVERFKEFAADSVDRDSSRRFTCEMQTQDYGYTYIWFDPKSRKSRWESAYRLGIDKDGRVYSLVLDKQDVDKKLFIGPFYGFERLLFQMKVAGTKLVIDCDPANVDTSYDEDESD